MENETPEYKAFLASIDKAFPKDTTIAPKSLAKMQALLKKPNLTTVQKAEIEALIVELETEINGAKQNGKQPDIGPSQHC